MRSVVISRGSRRACLVGGALALAALAVAGPVPRVISLVGASDWGSDWRWLADGLARLAAGLPLTRPEYAAGPFSQFDPGPTYVWSLQPPFVATLVAPLLALPAEARQAAWTLLMAGALLVALGLAWPRRLWWGTNLLVAVALLGTPWLGSWSGFIDQVHFANPNALVALAIVLTWRGRDRGSASMVAAGLVLAAVKIVPAIAVGSWLLAGWRPGGSPDATVRTDQPGAECPDRAADVAVGRADLVGRALARAVAVLVVLTLPVLLLDPGALADTVRSNLNLMPVADSTNVAPRVLLAPLVGTGPAAILSWAVGLGLLALVVARRMDGPAGLVLAVTAVLFMTPQLWAHWFVVPSVAALAVAGSWPALRRLDSRLRDAWGIAPVPERRRPQTATGPAQG